MMTRRHFAIGVLVGSVAAPAAAQDGRLTGCSTDPTNSTLPGVTILAQRDGGTTQAVTMDDGCYAFPRLAPGSYTLLACLVGFTPVGRDDVVVTAGHAETWSPVLRPEPIREQIYIPTAADLWKLADVVVRVRVTGYRFGLDSDLAATAMHEARILTIWKTDARVAGDSVAFQQGLEGECPPYEAGRELVLFLQWNPGVGAFERVGGINGAFTLAAGRLTYAGLNSYYGKDVDAFIAELNALAGVDAR
jgi:hypothetical protein